MDVQLQTFLNLKSDRQKGTALWWLIIPAGFAFFASIAVFIFSSFYDWEIAVYFGNFFHKPFGNFLAHWANYTGNKMIFLAIVPAVMILIETYFLKAKVYKPQSFLARHQGLLIGLYITFFLGFIGLNSWELWRQRFADHGWGPGIIVSYIETYETGLIFKSVFFGINFIYYIFVTNLIHNKLAPKQLLIKYDYWVASLKILLFAILIYFLVGITKVAMQRPFYFSNIYQVNPDGGKTILQEMAEAGFGPPLNDGHLQLPYMNWWEPFHPFPNWHELITIDFNTYLYNADFPSGHIASAAILLSLFFYGLDSPQKSGARKLTIGFCCLMYVQLLAIYLGMVIYRFHWLSDMAFTMIFNVAFIWFVHVKITFWNRSGFLRKYLPLLAKNDKINIVTHENKVGN